MNNAKMWLVVKPTVGIPLFLSAVAVGSFAVHVAVLSNTTWVADFLSGQPLGAGATAALPLPADGVAKVAFVEGGAAAVGQQVLVILPDGTTARAVIGAPAGSATLN
ncbi:MAG: light-harvesting protein [Gemmobacter sp.]|jgi:light-harvesting protein B-800-850 alpha chain